MAAEIAALLIAADFATVDGPAQPAEFLRHMADTWNYNMERRTYAVNTDLARQVGVEGYYVRITPPPVPTGPLRPCRDSFPSRIVPLGSFECAGGGDRQPGCARAGALRPARARRSANPEHRSR